MFPLLFRHYQDKILGVFLEIFDPRNSNVCVVAIGNLKHSLKSFGEVEMIYLCPAVSWLVTVSLEMFNVDFVSMCREGPINKKKCRPLALVSRVRKLTACLRCWSLKLERRDIPLLVLSIGSWWFWL